MKFGIIVATHGDFGKEAVETVKKIVGEHDYVSYISVDYDKNLSIIQEEFEKLVNKFLKKYRHVLILTDMFGGTPSNISFGFVRTEKVEVIAGFNLPMLIKAAKLVGDNNASSLNEIVTTLAAYGKDNIKIASRALL